jgi:hypothetical protein
LRYSIANTVVWNIECILNLYILKHCFPFLLTCHPYISLSVVYESTKDSATLMHHALFYVPLDRSQVGCIFYCQEIKLLEPVTSKVAQKEYDVMHCQRKCFYPIPSLFGLLSTRLNSSTLFRALVLAMNFISTKICQSATPHYGSSFLFGPTRSILPLFKTTYNSCINHEANLCVQLTTELHVSVSKIPRCSLSPNLHY